MGVVTEGQRDSKIYLEGDFLYIIGRISAGFSLLDYLVTILLY